MIPYDSTCHAYKTTNKVGSENGGICGCPATATNQEIQSFAPKSQRDMKAYGASNKPPRSLWIFVLVAQSILFFGFDYLPEMVLYFGGVLVILTSFVLVFFGHQVIRIFLQAQGLCS